VPTWLAIVIGVVVVVIVLLAVGGYVANRRARAAGGAAFEAHVLSADQDLATAHAADRGWNREALEAAAGRAWGERHPGTEPDSVLLVQVVDPAGTEEDKAVFLVESGGRPHRLTLGRRGDEWVGEHID
jgi:hypothetical protein